MQARGSRRASPALHRVALKARPEGDYDIKLKEPLETQTTGGAMFPTTTIVTKDRIYVPGTEGAGVSIQDHFDAKEFYVRFDTIP